ncbi:MAG TPA: anhydro-N-acetylmuramic acid kinase [Candidatus Sulfotelmatobacter sp.]|jgi:anhydro-N-acetylmuramic acid kinase|nr:anhydro-N-acetylmuramic acid kinase [Candidatus Sulfotelmatobacter sp.]
MKKKEMIVAGVMSGTSADGINVALIRMESNLTSRTYGRTPFDLLGHAEYSYSKKVRAAVLAAMNASRASVADLARLNFLLGELYSDSILATERQFRVKVNLVGCHGQTLYHQGEPVRFLGRKLTVTWQTGEGAIIAARVGAPVVSDFRPADMAAGGKGAPLVPFLDYLLFRDPHVGRIAQNIGGIANLTAIPPGAAAHDVVAFDTGPGNMVIDALADRLFHQPFDRGGRIAASGKVIDRVLTKILQRDFFRKAPPKTAGREEFGREFVREFLRLCGRRPKQDVIATATALTARSIADAVQRYTAKQGSRKSNFTEMILSGGGAKNSTLVTMLAGELAPLGLQLRFSDEFGLPSAAKEAVAFAVLAYETWHRRPSNVPSATGAKRAALLGKISYP